MTALEQVNPEDWWMYRPDPIWYYDVINGRRLKGGRPHSDTPVCCRGCHRVMKIVTLHFRHRHQCFSIFHLNIPPIPRQYTQDRISFKSKGKGKAKGKMKLSTGNDGVGG